MQPGQYVEPVRRLGPVNFSVFTMSYFDMVPGNLPSQLEIPSTGQATDI